MELGNFQSDRIESGDAGVNANTIIRVISITIVRDAGLGRK